MKMCANIISGSDFILCIQYITFHSPAQHNLSLNMSKCFDSADQAGDFHVAAAAQWISGLERLLCNHKNTSTYHNKHGAAL